MIFYETFYPKKRIFTLDLLTDNKKNILKELLKKEKGKFEERIKHYAYNRALEKQLCHEISSGVSILSLGNKDNFKCKYEDCKIGINFFNISIKLINVEAKSKWFKYATMNLSWREVLMPDEKWKQHLEYFRKKQEKKREKRKSSQL